MVNQRTSRKQIHTHTHSQQKRQRQQLTKSEDSHTSPKPHTHTDTHTHRHTQRKRTYLEDGQEDGDGLLDLGVAAAVLQLAVDEERQTGDGHAPALARRLALGRFQHQRHDVLLHLIRFGFFHHVGVR